MLNHLINLLIRQTIKNNVKVPMVGYFWQFLRQLLFWLRHSEQWSWHEKRLDLSFQVWLVKRQLN